VREPSPAALAAMFLQARCMVEGEAADSRTSDVEVFKAGAGVAVTMAHPVVRAALHVLIDARPAPICFDHLLAQTRSRLGANGADVTADVLADAMLRCAMVRLVDLTTHASRCAMLLTERPAASPLARLEAAREPVVSSLSHVQVQLSDFDRHVLVLLDGTRDVEALVDDILDAVARGALDLGASRSRESVAEVLRDALEQFRICALLVA
jgi:methyltransferase-like protein